MQTSPSAVLTDIRLSLDTIRAKTGRLMAERDELLSKIQSLTREVEDLKSDLEDTRKELHQARLDNEYLSLSYKLADNPAALAEARHTIASLIRKIDVAINMIKNDPAEE